MVNIFGCSSKYDAKELDTLSGQQVISMKDYILQKAKPYARKVLIYDNDPSLWGVLTAITGAAIHGRGYQGERIELRMAEHCIGLVLKEMNFEIPNKEVNNDYGIYLTRVERANVFWDFNPPVFVRNTSTFDAYVNWQRVTKEEPVQIHHGDIISLLAAPDEVEAVGYVFQRVFKRDPWQAPGATINDQFKEFLAKVKNLFCI